MLTRKTFLVQLAGGGWLLALGGCGGGGGSYGGTAPPAAGTCGAVGISNNHGHALAIPVADLSSATSRTYSIQGASDHNHDVTLSAAQLAMLKAGQAVTVTSTQNNAHSHDVTEACS